MSKPQWFYTLRNSPLRLFVVIFIGLLRILPERASFVLGRSLGLLVWHAHARWRANSVRNLELFFGDEYDHAGRLAIGRQAAVNLAYHVIEFIRMGFLPPEKALGMVIENEGLELWDEAIARGKGVIGLAMHYGNWELCGASVVNTGHTLYAVGKEQRDEFFTKIAFPWRAKYGIKNIYAGDKVNSAILRALRENAVLGLIADQNGGKNGTFAPFAGTEASTVAGPAALALKTGAPMVVTYCKRISPGRHRFVNRPGPTIDGLPDDKQEALRELLTRINSTYEQVIREDPTQWLWGHKRWKTRPPGEPPLY